HNNSLLDSYYSDEPKPEQALAQGDIDCLIVTWYNDELTGDGDYTRADMKEFATSHVASFLLGIAAFKPMEEPRSWLMRSRTLTDGDDLLSPRFLPIRQAWRGDLGLVEGDLHQWLNILDNAMASDNMIKPKPRDMLQKALRNASQIIGHPVKASD